MRQPYRRSELIGATVGTNLYGYAYDTIGNRTSDTLNGMSRSYAANCLNQYAQIDAAQMAYDADGNLVRDDRFAYAYDAENRMLSARPIAPSEGDLAVVNAYDHKHRRIMKRVERFDGEEWQTSETHAFAYDGSNIALERIAFADGTTRTVEYFWGPDLSNSIQEAGGVGGFTLLFSNENMYDDWNTTVEHIRKDDKFYSHTKGKCEVLEIQYGDRGVSPIRIRFE